MSLERLSFLVAAILAICGACRPSDMPGRTGSIDGGEAPDNNDTGVPYWSAETTWRFEEDLRIGGVDGDTLYEFGQVSSVAADSRGVIYVVDGMAREVRTYNPDGSFRSSVGREGHGPGEFIGVSAVSVGPGDTLLALDFAGGRYSLFDPEGLFVKSYPRLIGGYVASLSGVVQSDGSFVDWDLTFPAGRMGPLASIEPIKFDLETGEAHDTFPPIAHEWPMLPRGRMPDVTFGGNVIAAAVGDGTFWFAHSREYRVFRRTLDGDTVGILEGFAEPAPLDEADREFIRNRFQRRPDLVADYLSILPKTRPIVFGIVPDGNGHVYVFLDAEGSHSGGLVDVFTNDGRYLGQMEFPLRLRPRRTGEPPVVFANNEYILVVVSDSLDVPYVSRLRILRP